MSEPLNAALIFLINTIFDIYLFILIVRLILVWVRADYFNPLVQFIVKMTDFIIKPLRRSLPNIGGRLEIASLVTIVGLEIAKFFLLLLLTFGLPNIFGVIILSMGDLIKLIIQALFYGILLQVLLSWVQPYSPMNRLLYQFTSPIMQPLHRMIPPIGGFDISPIPALIVLQLLIIMLVNPLMSLGSNIAFTTMK